MSDAAKKKLNPKQKRQIAAWIRRGVQLFFFILFPSAYTAAFQGVKYIFTQIGLTEVIEITNFVYILIGLCVYTIIFGRFFCGYACAFGSFGDWLHDIYVFVCRKLKKKTVQIPEKVRKVLSVLKYDVLVLIVLLCFFGLYGNTKGMSPWDVFSLIRSGNFALSGYAIGGLVLALIMIGMCVQERFFCRFLCPMGAVFSILPALPFFTLHRERENCIKNCKACTTTCPADIGLPNKGDISVSGDCFQCQKCNGICPKSNISTGIPAVKGNELWFILLRAAILAAVFIVLGV